MKDRYLDKGRLHPVLHIKRRQLPLTLAFAMTAHAAQGQTFSKGAIVDPNIGGSSSAMSSYVALTRVERRNDLLIFDHFHATSSVKGKSKDRVYYSKCGAKTFQWIGQLQNDNICLAKHGPAA